MRFKDTDQFILVIDLLLKNFDAFWIWDFGMFRNFQDSDSIKISEFLLLL